MWWKRLFRRRWSQNAALAQALRLAAEGRRAAIYERATGLYAYWYLQLRVEEEIARSERAGGSLGCLSLWASEDPGCIEALCATLRELRRRYDMAAYLNNGHFVVMLPDTDAVGAHVMLQRIAVAAGAHLIGGVAIYPIDGQTFEGLLEQAKARAVRADSAA